MSWFKRLLGRDKNENQNIGAFDDEDIVGSNVGARVRDTQKRSDGPATGGRGGAQSTDGAAVPMHMFLEFKNESSRRYSELRGQYQVLVRENDGLKQAVVAVNNKLDQILKEQTRFRMDAEEGLRSVRQDVAQIKSASDPELRAKMVGAQSALTSLKGAAGAPDRRSESAARL